MLMKITSLLACLSLLSPISASAQTTDDLIKGEKRHRQCRELRHGLQPATSQSAEADQ